MTATDEVRAELTKRGVEWIDIPLVNMSRTCWKASDEQDGYCFYEEDEYETELTISRATPEQAIEATLGRGTCHNVVLAEMEEKISKKYSMAMSALRFGGFMPEDEPAEFECSACGETAKVDWETLYQMSYCPFCGARIVEVN